MAVFSIERGYAEASVRGRSHATRHHYVAKRFFGRSANRPGAKRGAVFVTSLWGHEGRKTLFCYECHEGTSSQSRTVTREFARGYPREASMESAMR